MSVTTGADARTGYSSNVGVAPPRSERLTRRFGILRARTREWLAYDASFARQVVALAGFVAARILMRCGRRRGALALCGILHRSAYSAFVSGRIDRMIRDGLAEGAGTRSLISVFRNHVDSVQPTAPTAKLFTHPEKFLGGLAIVLKSASALEKGVVVLYYSHSFPYFAKLFDVERIAERYHIVLEPSWSGFCDANVLCYSQYAFPVFVEGYEPRDNQFIADMRSNLVSVPGSSNWWVDHRVFRPLPGVRKDVDIVMIAGWSAYKRHERFFAALGALRRRGVRLKVVLIGYDLNLSKEAILQQADVHGVRDQLECHERLTPVQVNEHLNRAKVNIIWSRKEGVNRAIIEGMFAGVPCILRDGFNYGYRYPYVNESTGCFSSEADLPQTLVSMIADHDRYRPREWVLANMSCQRAAERLGDAMGRAVGAAGGVWSGGLAVKLNGLEGQYYWDPSDAARFASDYEWLRTTIRAR